MQSGILIVCFVLTAIVLQFCGFLIGQVIDRIWPTAGLLTFLLCFLPLMPLAWPIAVRIAEGLIRRAGYVVEQNRAAATRGVIPLHPTTPSGARHSSSLNHRS